MTGESHGSCIPAVELAHYLDPLDTDDGPLQRLALRASEDVEQPARETAPAPVSDVVSITPDTGYPLAV